MIAGDTITQVYRRFRLAVRSERGLRLSAGEVEALYYGDEAIRAAVENIAFDDGDRAAQHTNTDPRRTP